MAKILLFVVSLVFLVDVVVVTGVPLEDSLGDKFPVMVPVSSTVIPVVNLFGPPRKFLAGGATIPKRSSAYYLSPSRRARLLERSSRPDTPVRLITKNSKQKDLVNETH